MFRQRTCWFILPIDNNELRRIHLFPPKVEEFNIATPVVSELSKERILNSLTTGVAMLNSSTFGGNQESGTNNILYGTRITDTRIYIP